MPKKHGELYLVSIETVDQAVKDWFDIDVDVKVLHPGSDNRKKKVPVLFSSGERWITGRTRRGIRDKNGVLILPVISIRRTGIQNDKTQTALGIETPNMTFSRRIDDKTSNLKNLAKLRASSLSTGENVVYEVASIPFPDRCVIDYELVVHAQYMIQMNEIIEKIFRTMTFDKQFVARFDPKNDDIQIDEAFESRLGAKQGYVVGFFEDAMNSRDNFEEFSDQERIVKYSTTFRVPTALNIDAEGENPSVQYKRTTFNLLFGDEQCKFVDDPRELDIVFGRKE